VSVDLGPHAGFIVAAYGVALLVLIVLIGWIALDYRTQRRRVAELESQGVTRRSVQAKSSAKRLA
jgi:heme exporter protein D